MYKDKSTLHETNRYDDDAFPFGVYTITHDSCTPNGRGFNDVHWHEELQFTYIIHGSVDFKIQDTIFTLHAGEAIFINKGVIHHTVSIRDSGTYLSYNFTEAMLSCFNGSRIEQDYVIPYLHHFSLTTYIYRPNVFWQKECLELLSLLYEIYDKKTYAWELQITTYLNQLWFQTITHLDVPIDSHTKTYRQKKERLQLLRTYIHNHYAEDISLQDIANAAHVSAGEATRCFKNTMATTPYEYLINYRMKQSLSLLSESSYSITEIASLVGFQNVNHYIQTFKRRMHKTPHVYRTSLL